MNRDVQDYADTVKGQLSYVEYLLNVYSDNVYSPNTNELLDILQNAYQRLGVAQNNIASMIDAYGIQEKTKTSKRVTTNNLVKTK